MPVGTLLNAYIWMHKNRLLNTSRPSDERFIRNPFYSPSCLLCDSFLLYLSFRNVIDMPFQEKSCLRTNISRTVFLPSAVKFVAVVCLLLHCYPSRYNYPLVPPVPSGDYHDGQTQPSSSKKLCNVSYVISVNIFFVRKL